MSHPQAYLNGDFVPSERALLPVADAGFVQGTTVAEQLRTFGGRLFRLEMHLARLFRSLEIVGLLPRETPDELTRIAGELVAGNHPLLAEGDDLGLAMFVTPGIYPAMKADGPQAAAEFPTVCLHTFPLQFHLWADKYASGEALATTAIEQVSPRSWPPALKCRSRMHYYLADRTARRVAPGSRALLLDDQGFVVEASTANVLLYRKDMGLILPPIEKVLPGISQAVLLEIAEELELPIVHRDLKPADVADASEVFLTSTSPCVLPVTRFNGRPIGSGQPGPMFAAFVSAWNEIVDLDIVAQAKQFSRR